MKYYAFISYNKEDEKWAKWLHSSIERYRIPSRLKIDTKRLKPIFLDREELPAAPSLSNKIKDALEQSEYLIVICSPHSAKSDWVNNEISEFIRLGRSDRILCAIVKGEPYVKADELGKSTNSEECIPKTLRFELDNQYEISEHMTLAADLRPGKDGKGKALLKLIAAIIGVDFDALNRRDQKRQNQRKGVVACIFLMLTAAGIWYWINFERQTSSYYISAWRQWGEYVGISPVSEEELKNREGVLRFIRKGWQGKLERVEIVNSDKKLSISMNVSLGTYLPEFHPDGVIKKMVARIDYIRDNKERLMQEIGYNDMEEIVYKLDYTVAYLPGMKHSVGVFYIVSGVDSRTDSNAGSVEFLRYTEDKKAGLDYEINYSDAYGKPQPDNQGIYGQRLEYKGSKLPTRIVFVGKEGEPKRAKGTNFSTTVFSYNKLGQPTVIEMVDDSSQSKSTEDNENVVYTDYDKNGNVKKMIVKITSIFGILNETKMIFQKGIMRESITTIFTANKMVLRSFLNSRMQIGMTKEGISSIKAEYNADKQIPHVTIMRLSKKPQDKKVEKLSQSGIKLPNVEKVPCVVIDEVISGSVAANVGIKPGDLILSYGGKDTPNADTLVQFTEDTNWPEEIEVIVIREIEILTFQVPPGRLGVHVSDN